MNEKEFASQVEQLFNLFGWRYYHTWTSIHSPKGFPDYVAVRIPRVIYIELKSDTGELTWEQAEWLTMLQDSGQEVYAIWPDDWDLLIRILEKGG